MFSLKIKPTFTSVFLSGFRKSLENVHSNKPGKSPNPHYSGSSQSPRKPLNFLWKEEEKLQTQHQTNQSMFL